MSSPLTTGNKLTFLGHSAVHLVTSKGRKILIDPWVINNPRTPENWKDVGPLDTFLITHGHFDHIGDAVEIGKATGAQLLGVKHGIPIHFATFPLLTGTPDAFRTELDKLGVKADVTVLEPGETLGE